MPDPAPEEYFPPPKVNKERLRYVVLDCLDAGKTRQEIRDKLMVYGYSEIDADRFIEDIEREQRNTRAYDDEFRGDARFLMAFGASAFGLGMVVLAICILIACYNSDFVHDPVWLAVMFIAGAAKFFGARLFYRGYFQAS